MIKINFHKKKIFFTFCAKFTAFHPLTLNAHTAIGATAGIHIPKAHWSLKTELPARSHHQHSAGSLQPESGCGGGVFPQTLFVSRAQKLRSLLMFVCLTRFHTLRHSFFFLWLTVSFWRWLKVLGSKFDKKGFNRRETPKFNEPCESNRQLVSRFRHKLSLQSLALVNRVGWRTCQFHVDATETGASRGEWLAAGSTDAAGSFLGRVFQPRKWIDFWRAKARSAENMRCWCHWLVGWIFAFINSGKL